MTIESVPHPYYPAVTPGIYNITFILSSPSHIQSYQTDVFLCRGITGLSKSLIFIFSLRFSMDVTAFIRSTIGKSH